MTPFRESGGEVRPARRAREGWVGGGAGGVRVAAPPASSFRAANVDRGGAPPAHPRRGWQSPTTAAHPTHPQQHAAVVPPIFFHRCGGRVVGAARWWTRRRGGRVSRRGGGGGRRVRGCQDAGAAGARVRTVRGRRGHRRLGGGLSRAGARRGCVRERGVATTGDACGRTAVVPVAASVYTVWLEGLGVGAGCAAGAFTVAPHHAEGRRGTGQAPSHSGMRHPHVGIGRGCPTTGLSRPE